MTASSYPGPESIRQEVLSNGITVLAYENFSSPTVVVQGLVRAGALLEPAEQAGLADFTSDLLMRGTQRRDGDAIYEALEAVGAGLSFGSGRHTTQFNAYGLVEDLDLLFDLTTESLCRPTFPPEQVELVRGQILTGLQMRANDTGRMARLRFNERLYAGHPYAPSISGYESTIKALTRDDLAHFHETHFGPDGMIVTVVGAIAAEDAVARVAAALGDWTTGNGRQADDVPDQPRPVGLQRQSVRMPDKIQSDLIMGLPGPRRSAEDYLEASLMNTILGVFGMMGRIGQSVREEQGLAYYAYSRLAGGLGPGAWTAVAGVAPGDVEQAVDSIRVEIRRIQDEPVEADELADSKAYRTGSLPVSLETSAALADIISDMAFYDLGLDFLQTYADRINRITADDVQAAARKYLSADDLLVVVAGPDGTAT